MQKDDLVFEDLYKPFTIKKALGYLITIGLIVFFNMLLNGFAWDDISYILYNPEVRSVDIFSKLVPNSFNHATQYRAFTMLYFSFMHAIFSMTPFFYHLMQLLIHLANTIMLFLLFMKFFKLLPSFVLSLFFLVHPIQVESVSFIGSTGNPLFFLFGITSLTLLLNKHYVHKTWVYVIITLLLFLCFLTKETGLSFMVLTTLVVFMFHKQYLKRIFIVNAVAFAGYLAIRVGIGGILFTETNTRAITPIIHLSLTERIINIPAVVFYYIKTLVYPMDLAIDQIWVVRSIDFPNFYLPLVIDLFVVGLIVALGFVLYKRRIHRMFYTFFLLWFASGMAVHLQLFPLDMTVADRWFYFPFAGLLGLIGLAITVLPKKITSNQLLLTIVCIVLILFSLRTIIRNLDWKDDITLLKHDTQVITNFELENNLGSYLTYQRDFKEAIVHYKKSISLYAYDKNLTNLGYVYEQVDDNENAKKAYEQAIKLYDTPQTYTLALNRAYARLSGIYLFNKNPEKAERILKEGVQRYPKDGLLWSFLAVSQYDQKKQSEALKSAQKAKEVFPIKSTATLYDLIKNNKPVDIKNL